MIYHELSDIFFNHFHAEYQALFQSTKKIKKFPPSAEQIEEAILKDAQEFVEAYPGLMEWAGDFTAEDLAKDFLNRR